MALLEIIVAPDPRLKRKAEAVERVDSATALRFLKSSLLPIRV